MTRRRTRLEVTRFEDRVNPVLGGYDVPSAVDTNDPVGTSPVDLSGVVEFNGNNTGALLDRGALYVGSQYVITAAHNAPAVGDKITFFRRLSDGNIQQVQIPVTSVWTDPAWTGNVTNNDGDVALVRLAAIAPQDAVAYELYTSAQAAIQSEVGQVYYMAGFGRTGTGLSGTAVNQEIQRMTISANGGSFSIVRPDTAATSTPISPSFATPTLTAQTLNQITAALASIGLPGTPQLVTTGPYAPNPNTNTNSLEILFTNPVNVPRLTFISSPTQPLVNNGNFGTVTFTTLVNGGINPEFQRLAVTATGGTFRLGYGNQFTAQIPYNATPAQIQAALEGLNTPGPGPGEVTVRQLTGGPNAGTYEISFDSIGFDIPLLTVDTTKLTGPAATATVSTIMDGGTPVLRAGQNVNDAIVGGDLRNDFSSNGTDAFAGNGDPGAPGFLIVGGQPRLISVESYATGPAGFGATGFDTRLSKYSTDILNEAAGITPGNPPLIARRTVTLDMQYQPVGDDGIPDTITVTQATVNGTPVLQIWVQEQGGAKVLYYQDTLDTNPTAIATVRLIGSADDETFVLDPSLTVAVTVDGGFGTNTVDGPGLTTGWRVTGADQGTGHTAAFDFGFQNVQDLVGGAGADTFAFDPAGSLSGTLDGGTGADTLDFSAATAGVTARFTAPGTADGFKGTVAPVAGGFDNVDGFAGNPNAGTDVIVTPDTGGTFTHTAAAGSFVESTTGRVLTYRDVDGLTGGVGNDTFNIRSTGANALTVDGGGGTDVVNVAGDAPTDSADGVVGGPLTFVGEPGNGTVSVRLNGTAADDAVTAHVSAPYTGDLTGLSYPVTFNGITSLVFDARGGTNSFLVQDTSGSSLGTPTDPGSGFVYYPTGPTGGNARLNGVTVGAAGINNGFTVNGDPTGAGDKDVLLVVGTSAPGLRSAYGEAVVGDGRDTITVSDAQVTVKSAVAGTLLPVTIGYTPSGAQAFSTLYVAGGNEAGNVGDTINVTTSLTFNVVADGMLPSASARPGDRVIVTAPGGGDAQLVTDPSLGPTQTRVTARADGSSVGLVGFESGTPAVPGAGMIAVASDAGTPYPTTVRVFDRVTGVERFEVIPFPDSNLGAKVASGDVNGDGIADLVVGAGPGGGPRVAVYDGLTGNQLYDFFGYEDTFRGGVTVAVGDVDLDGYGDIILGTGVGGGPRVRVLSGKDLTPIKDAFAYEPTFRGGVSVAAADVNGDGVPDLITSTGTGGGPRVVVLDGKTLAQLASFFVFDPNTRVGFTATGADVNGDGYADIIVGSGAGSAAEVRVFSGFNRALLKDFYVNDPFNPGATGSIYATGVRVAAADVDGDGVDDVVTGLGPGGNAVVRTYKVTGVNPQTNALYDTLQEIGRISAFDEPFTYGIYVGASD